MKEMGFIIDSMSEKMNGGGCNCVVAAWCGHCSGWR